MRAVLIIKDIIWISEEIGEADVVVTDGNYEITCFSHPFFQKKGEEVRGTISVFEYSNLERSEKTEYVVEHLGNGKYFLVGRLLDDIKGIVQIGEIYIHDIEEVPAGIKKGEYIQFTTLRVDLW